MKYTSRPNQRRWPRRLLAIVLVGGALVIGTTIAVRMTYSKNLEPLNPNTQPRLITIEKGASLEAIAKHLEDEGLIRSAWAFQLYVSSKEVRGALQAGSYEFASSQSVPEIVSQLTYGRVTTNLVTILPGQRIDQTRRRLIQEGFRGADVDVALSPGSYSGHPALVDKPANVSLEGYLYPDSYQKGGNTSADDIVRAALDEMNDRLTPELRGAFARQGLSTYQAIILASIVEKEVPSQADREKVAQVFLKRLQLGIRLQSDATTSYGAILAGQKPVSGYPSAYNTYQNAGLTPTPISNVSTSSLRAVAYPADTDWLYFVSDDDGTTHFSRTLAEHQANVTRYCTVACKR